MELIRKTIDACLKERMEKTPDKVAVEMDGQILTWSGLFRLTEYMAVRMHRDGVKKGTHAAIWSTNSINWIITFLALTKLGAVPVLINTCYTKGELLSVLRYSDVKYVYFGEGYKKINYQELVPELREELKDRIRNWTYIGPDPKGYFFSEKDFTEERRETQMIQILSRYSEKVDCKDIAAILFTSGTTAEPKGVMLTHFNLINSAYATSRHMQWNEKDKMLIAVPMFHCFGITSSLLSGILCGFRMCVIRYYKTLTVLEKVQRAKCTLLNGVPSMFLAMVHNPKHTEYDLSSLRRGIIAGSPYTKEEYMLIRKEMPGFVLHASYGQTETSPCVSIGDVGDSDEKNATTAGRVVEGCRVGIFDLKTGRDITKEKEHPAGEIRVRGYNVMSGYYKLEKETKQTIDQDGWLHTGDAGFLDEDGFLCVSGRIKDIIIRGGENISPGEVEAAIRKYPGIMDVKVVGIPTKVLQEMIVACIIPKADAIIDETHLKTFLEECLAYYKIPEHIVVFDRFPLSSSGKILTRALKEIAADSVAKMK